MGKKIKIANKNYSKEGLTFEISKVISESEDFIEKLAFTRALKDYCTRNAITKFCDDAYYAYKIIPCFLYGCVFKIKDKYSIYRISVDVFGSVGNKEMNILISDITGTTIYGYDPDVSPIEKYIGIIIVPNDIDIKKFLSDHFDDLHNTIRNKFYYKNNKVMKKMKQYISEYVNTPDNRKTMVDNITAISTLFTDVFDVDTNDKTFQDDISLYKRNAFELLRSELDMENNHSDDDDDDD